jgi:hypothetical protein
MSTNRPFVHPALAAPAAQALPAERLGFIRRTYAHVAGAIAAFVVLEIALFQVPGIERLVGAMVGGRGWLVVLAAFMGVSWLADRWARSGASAGVQYLGLGVFVAAEAVIFLPLLWVAASLSSPTLLPTAAGLTLLTFGGLTAVVLTWKQDFSFLRPILAIGGLIALGVIVASLIFGFDLGVLFSAVMVAFATGAILFQTSAILLHYRTDQHVAAALGLFSSVALLFWYVLRLLMAFSRR